MQTFKIHTLGCKVNQYDSQVIREQLERLGLKELNDHQKADYYIINTCTVTNKADSQSRNLIRSAIKENPFAKVIATGCYAHSNAKDIKEINGVDLILNNHRKQDLSKYLFRLRETDYVKEGGISDFKGHTRAFVKVQDGCDNFCSFCKVPYVRGRSRSRDLKSIINEINKLADNDYREVVLTGICLGDYGKDFTERIDLVDLIDEIEKISGIFRIRLSSIEAKDITPKLIQKMKTSGKLCPHLHIPFQSADNDILRLMNRRDSRDDYLRLVYKLRNNIKDIGITTDIMIGFPGEDDKKFKNTLSFLEKIIPARVHIFTFNSRDKTKLSNIKNIIPNQILKYRYVVIRKLAESLSLKFRKQFQNQALEVLFEEEKQGYWRGYTRNYLPVCLKNREGLDFKNKIINVRIKKITTYRLDSEIKE